LAMGMKESVVKKIMTVMISLEDMLIELYGLWRFLEEKGLLKEYLEWEKAEEIVQELRRAYNEIYGKKE